ncbi:MAG: glycosyltransferase family 2 protein [Deltaproteobacteria bacterium]|nr:MAG: glycosyltransferase family 2 protein [Deltaproteobacteria bacterium]
MIPLMRLLSVIMPVFNERATVETIVERVLGVELPLELVIVDDLSSDGTIEVLEGLAGRDNRIRLVRHGINRGKGAAVRTGFEHARGDVMVIQDADLEYDPACFPRLLGPIEHDLADVVYGSRILGPGRRGMRPIQLAANKFLTGFSNIMTGLRLSDMETCYKMFRAELVRGVEFRSERFGIEPELTAHFAGLGARIAEVPIDYDGRDHAAGKKIGIRDGVEALWAILRFSGPAARREKRQDGH